MAHAISLTDGTTTVDLYNLGATPAVFATAWGLESRDFGGEAVSEISDSIEILISGSNVSTLQTTVRNIEKLLVNADLRRSSFFGPRVFVQVQLDGEASAWRSEVLGGKLELDQALDQWGRLKLEGVLALSRRPFWEGPRAQIPLTNSNGSNNTAGLTIWNHDDAGMGHDNYLQIASSDVSGVLPAPIELELKNTSGTTVAISTVYLSNNIFSDPANFPHFLEGEARDTGYGSIVASGTSSGGNYNSVSFSPGNDALMVFTLPTSTVTKAGGRWFRLLANFQYLALTAVVQPSIRLVANGTDLWLGSRSQPSVLGTDVGIKDLGAVPLPPGGDFASWGSVVLVLRFSSPSGTLSANLDFVQLTPVETFRILRLGYRSLANNDLILDNGTEGYAYTTSSSDPQGGVIATGNPLAVFPGKVQRIYFVCDEDNRTTTNISRTFTARAWYRPRRVTV